MRFPKNDILIAIGSALHEWSGIEANMADLFEIISDIPDRQKAHAVFDTIISLETRLAVLNTLMLREQVTALEAETWVRFSEKISKSYKKKRHPIAHFSLMGHASDEWTMHPFFTWGKMMRGENIEFSVSQIQEHEKRFQNLRFGLHWFQFEARSRRGLPPGNPMTEKPELVGESEEIATQILQERERKRRSSPGR